MGVQDILGCQISCDTGTKHFTLGVPVYTGDKSDVSKTGTGVTGHGLLQGRSSRSHRSKGIRPPPGRTCTRAEAPPLG